jgi:hypothetical protein
MRVQWRCERPQALTSAVLLWLCRCVCLLLSTMDYVDTDVASEFVFKNPNSKGACGCGESFNV